jgi:hypothetical protein
MDARDCLALFTVGHLFCTSTHGFHPQPILTLGEGLGVDHAFNP